MSIDYKRLAISIAKLSPAKKRKVGAVVVGDSIYMTGYNYNPIMLDCEDEEGKTLPDVIHAEISALALYTRALTTPPHTIYITHSPCAACQEAIQTAGITKIIIVEEFMKFDSDKLRYELIPPSTLKGLAKVLTYGAKKYKPNNWRKGDIDRYVGATMRHLEAWRRGEKRDPESDLLHLEHLLTNVCFLLELDDYDSDQN